MFLNMLFTPKLDEPSRVEEKVLLENLPVATEVLQ